MDLFRKIPLGTRYACGFALSLITGLLMIVGTKTSSTDYKIFWMWVTICAVTHWLITVIYFWWERRWYRFFILGLSALATGMYIQMTVRVWEQP